MLVGCPEKRIAGDGNAAAMQVFVLARSKARNPFGPYFSSLLLTIFIVSICKKAIGAKYFALSQ